MADLIKTGMETALDVMESHASRTVTYKRASDSVSVTAILGQEQPTPMNMMGQDRAINDATAPSPEQWGRDYFIRRSSLMLSGSAINPMVGDIIEDTNDATGQTWQFRVEAPTGGPQYGKQGYALWVRVKTRFFQVV